MSDVRKLVKVKPLEWHHDVTSWPKRQKDAPPVEMPSAEHWRAPTILLRGSYSIMRLVDERLVDKDDQPFRLFLGKGDVKFPTLEAAKAAAQADYEARIYAALTPASDGRAEGLREAGEIAKRYSATCAHEIFARANILARAAEREGKADE